jgi:hypothetical protein
MLSESERRAFGEFEKRGWEKAADPYHHHFGVLTRQSSEALLDAACAQTLRGRSRANTEAAAILAKACDD